jgi:head-tail adaptor
MSPRYTVPQSSSPIPAGRRIHKVVVQVPNLGSPPSQADGDFVEDWQDEGREPVWHVAIEPATTQAIERLSAGTSVSTASHIVTGPYRADVTTKARLLVDGCRPFNIIGRSDPGELHRELIVLCQEVEP